MRSFFRKFETLASSPRAIPVGVPGCGSVGLWFVCLAHGFYWDDLPMSWIRYELGPEAMRVYFSTSRPVWGAVYQITTRLLPQVPLYWQIFAIFGDGPEL